MATVDRPTRAATRMSVATLASRGIGFVRVWVIAAVLGTTFLGNAYQSSSSVSNVLFELLAAGALSAVLVPTFVHLLDAGKDREAEDLASGLLGLALAVMGVVCVLGMIAAPQIARLLSTGVHDSPGREATDRAVDLLPVLVHPAGAVLRVGDRRDRDPLRQAPLRDHCDRTDREHGVRRRRRSFCSA